MAERGSNGLPPRLDIKHILSEAQTRWLRPAEICEILRNYQKFQITSEPPNRATSGSFFLLDRKVLRYFRKDGHNWRKKKDGKTVKEAHEKLKVGSVDVLHCYYAHGEENENFQRRSYWMLEQDLTHIVFVHYLEVKGSRTNIGGIKESDEVTSNFQKDSPLSSSFSPNHNRVPCGSTDSPSPASSLALLYEDVDSEDVFQASSTSRSFLESQPMENGPLRGRTDAGVLNSYFPHPSADDHGLSSIPGTNYISQVWTDGSRVSDDIISPKTIDLASWEEILEHATRGFHSTVPSNVSSSSSQPASMGVVFEEENMTVGGLLANGSAVREEFQNFVPIQSNWQIPLGDNSVNLPIWPTDQSSHLELAYDPGTTLVDPKAHDTITRNGIELLSTHPVQQNEQPVWNKNQIELTNKESQSSIKSISKMDMPTEGNINYALTLKKHLIDGEQGLKRVDSFSRWASKELGDVDDFNLQTSSGISWSTVECGNVVDDASLSPSISQGQFFSIIDFSPKWAYTDSENEVLIIGKFLKSLPEVAKCKWSCMFGEVEVPAEVLAIGVLCCRAPPHSVGRVPFYVTCSNRLACSEVREFDYRVGSIKDIDIAIIYGGATTEMLLHMRLERLLSLISVSPPSHFVEGVPEKRDLISKVISLKEEEEYYQMAEPISQNDPSQYEVKEHLLKILMKEKLYSWLLHKVSEDGKGPSVLDDEGQGVLHLAAALGYDWAIKPIVTSGVSINFRDINGWTALHWAAYCGREQTVGFLVSLGASRGALTDPSPEFPLGRTPADLAGVNGHKGISGFLAEHLLTSYLKSLEMNDPNEVRTEVSGQKVSEQTVTPANYGDIPEALLLRDSLTAVSNGTLAADRIHLMFRMHSLERRQTTEYDDDDIVRLSDEHALSVVAAKTRKAKQSDGVVHAAATQIQKKFRGWKKRKEFLIIRQKIIKIQAHVRGHQVRKKYRTIIWSVGILEKVILRWRRKGIGLRGFRSDVRTEDPKPQDVPSKEDDYDFLKDGRKQTEERLQKALTRVKSMVQNPEARAQYSRLRTAVEGFRETKQKWKKGKSKDAGHYDVRTGWKDPTELKAFCDLCAAQVLNGKRNGGYLKKEGVDAVIKQLGEIGKMVTYTQFKNKWDHLRKQWKTWKEVFEHETELGYDLVTGKIEASDEWWTQKLEAYPKASTFKNKPMPNVESMKIMFEGPVAMGKNAFCTSGEIPKEPRKKHSCVQEKSDSLKNFSNLIVESRSVSTYTPFASTTAAEVQAVMDMVLTLPGVQLGDRLYMFSTCFFLGNQEARNMFATHRAQKEIQLRWLEMQYQLNPQFHL